MSTHGNGQGHAVTNAQCPLCGAKPGWPCVAPGGKYQAYPHGIRPGDAATELELTADELLREHRGW